MLGVLRYYYWGVREQRQQRDRIAYLSKLDVPGVRLRDVWSPGHTKAMSDAIEAVVSGEWSMVYDPTLPVYVTTDASGNHGFSVVANQYDKVTGKLRPIAFYAKGWIGAQLKWTPQVKECYAGMIAVTKVMPNHYPFANVIWLVDNKNLASEHTSKDLNVVRWNHSIRASGCVTRYWVPGDWNTIADYASRAVVADANGKLNDEEEFELHIYGLTLSALVEEGEGSGAAASGGGGAGTPAPVVHGHLHMAALAAKIVTAQEGVSVSERESWVGPNYSETSLGGRRLVLYDNRLVVPTGASDLKSTLMRMAHDDMAHYSGAERTVQQLKRQARVHWVGMSEDVTKYVASCFKCALGKAASHHKADRGELEPTISPHVHHTWYVDLKGPFPGGSGYLLAAVESITRFTKLRYVPVNTAKEVIEELLEVIDSFGTCPVVIRSDSGQPFDSSDYKRFCDEHGIVAVRGVPYHSAGQGMVESRFRGIAGSIMATLGARAPTTWYQGRVIANLESVINSTYVSSIGGSPSFALYGREPRTPLAALTDWTNTNFGRDVVGVSALTHNDYCEILAQHHSVMQNVQGLASLASSVAQAVTKRDWDASHEKSTFVVGDHILVLRVAPNRMASHFTGPYTVLTTSNSFVTAAHYLEPGVVHGPFHVSRVVPFDMSRATPAEIAQHQTEEGFAVVERVEDNRLLADGSREFLIKWLGVPITSWLASNDVRKILKVIEYCRTLGLPAPGSEPRRAATAVAARGTRAARAGRGAR